MDDGAGRDAILWAGSLGCVACRRVAFPTDAADLGGGWVLAAFPRSCEHVPAGTVPIDMRGVALADGGRRASLGELARYVPGRRCAGQSSKGLPCRAYAAPGSDYCKAHPAAESPV